MCFSAQLLTVIRQISQSERSSPYNLYHITSYHLPDFYPVSCFLPPSHCQSADSFPVLLTSSYKYNVNCLITVKPWLKCHLFMENYAGCSNLANLSSFVFSDPLHMLCFSLWTWLQHNRYSMLCCLLPHNNVWQKLYALSSEICRII